MALLKVFSLETYKESSQNWANAEEVVAVFSAVQFIIMPIACRENRPAREQQEGYSYFTTMNLNLKPY